MIRVTVTLVPLGDETRAREIASARIWNDASGTRAVGNYGYELAEAGPSGRFQARGRVTGFDRSMSVFFLLGLVLVDALLGRRKG